MKKPQFLTAFLGLVILAGISSSASAQLIKKPGKKQQPAKTADTDVNSSATV